MSTKAVIKFAGLAAMIVIIGLSAYAWNHWPVCPLRAVVSYEAPDPRLLERPGRTDERAAFAKTLANYGERYRETADGIMVTPRLYFDKELRWNYTNKN